MLGGSTDAHGGGELWHLLARTQTYHSPTSVPGEAGFVRRGGWRDLCTSLLSAARRRPISLMNWSQDASAPWAPIQVPACLLRQSPVWG